MIQINKPAKIHLPDLTTNGTVATNNIINNYNAGIRKFKFNNKIYGAKAVKDKLIKIQHDKCCFCERKVSAGEPGHIEHYRPKGGYKIDEKTPIVIPGYYWLAYDINNLYFSCNRCNSTYMKNYFPLSDETQRADNHTKSINNEDPLILNPANDPSSHVIFKREKIKQHNNSEYGRHTIRRTGLNRKALANERLEYLKMLDILAKVARGTSVDALEAQNHFRTISKPTSVFSYMVVCNYADLV